MFGAVRAWFSKHRKAVLVTATILAVTGTVAVVLIKGKKVEIPVKELAERIVPDVTETAEDVAQNVTVNINGEMKTFTRDSFIRKLPEGWKASPEKIAEAKSLDIDLKPGETLVNACIVTMRKAA